MKKKNQGVSLAELLAVVVIMGIIAAIAVPLVSGIIEDQKREALRADAYAVADAVLLYCIQNEGKTGCNKGTYFNLLNKNGSYSTSNFGGSWLSNNDDRYYEQKGSEARFNTQNSTELASMINKEFTFGEYYNIYTKAVNDDVINGTDFYIKIYSADLNVEYAGYPLVGIDDFQECDEPIKDTTGLGYTFACRKN